MILRNQVEWALHCCSILAAMPDDRYIPTKDLAEFHGVPKEYLSKALQALAQADIVEGTLGPKGGYRLARAPSAISFLDIVEAIEGKQRSFNCTAIIGNNPCLSKAEKKPSGVCAVAGVMWKADEAWRKELRNYTLADLAKQVARTVSSSLLEKNREWFLRRV